MPDLDMTFPLPLVNHSAASAMISLGKGRLPILPAPIPSLYTYFYFAPTELSFSSQCKLTTVTISKQPQMGVLKSHVLHGKVLITGWKILLVNACSA